MLVSQYNHILVVLSFVVAILAAYTALNMAARVAGSQGVAARIWLAGGGVAMGIGVWAMHFIGMLAMDLSMRMSYNATLTGLSMVIAVGSSLFALWLVSCEQLRLRRLLPGALVMGTGIVAMHYTGMAALEVTPGIIWDKTWVAISVAIALAASLAALWLTFRLRHEAAQVALMRMGAAITMGIAIAGMHYAGMKAAQFPVSTMAHHEGINGSWLARAGERCRTGHPWYHPAGVDAGCAPAGTYLSPRLVSGGSKPGAGPAGATGYADAPAQSYPAGRSTRSGHQQSRP
ncbi:diguanylate cyclase/phosphodiesterase [Enterobacter cloacae]|uniref:Diguanylate cyclase/phosphodiesterase n=1 Tax=Enterobacter cloacae TaxID=550 RepID=A0A377LS74_ENTCL|nr:diguanylate cyclase/phosphodiesterase [Enterobacter cloacae]